MRQMYDGQPPQPLQQQAQLHPILQPPPGINELNQLFPDIDPGLIAQISESLQIVHSSTSGIPMTEIIRDIHFLIGLITRALEAPSDNLLVRQPRAIDIWRRLFCSINFLEYDGAFSYFLRTVFALFQDIKNDDQTIVRKILDILVIHSSICPDQHFLQEFQSLIINCIVLDMPIIDERYQTVLELIARNILRRDSINSFYFDGRING
jgi:hypothetical protein